MNLRCVSEEPALDGVGGKPDRAFFSFRDAAQRARACRTLLATVGLEHLWTGKGPRREGHAYHGAVVTDQQVTVLLVAWAIWNGSGMVEFREILGLSPEPLAVVSELLGAMSRGPTSVDAWMAARGEGARSR